MVASTSMPSEHPVLVTGATGTIGREVVASLLARGARVRVLVRFAERVAHLPPTVERAVGDLRDRASVRRAMEAVRSAFYASPHEADEEAIAETFVSLCEETGIRLVFAGVHVELPTRPLRRFVQWYFGRRFPHYRPKLRIGERVRSSRAEPIVIQAGTFAQNDEIFRAEILAGRYVQPLRSVSHVDVRDVGDAAARALTDASLSSGVYPVAGPGTRSGAQYAAVWSEALGYPVRYTGDDLAAFEAILDARLEGRKRDDFRRTFRILAGIAVPAATPRELARTAALLGRRPRSYEEYVRDAAARWRLEACA
jgi:uncharacterized protein YbjT (DUF2867 family)